MQEEHLMVTLNTCSSPRKRGREGTSQPRKGAYKTPQLTSHLVVRDRGPLPKTETRRGGCSLFLLTNKCRHGGPHQSIWQGQEIQRIEIEKENKINTWYDHVFGTT